MKPPRRPPAPGATSAALLCCTALLLSCGAAPPQQKAKPLDPEVISFGEAQRETVRGTPATLEIPAGFERASDRAWVVKHDGKVTVLLTVQHGKLPEHGVAHWLEARIHKVQSTGMAGITRNEAVELGDLDGRYIEAIDLVGDHRKVLFQVVAGSERGLFVANLYAPMSFLKVHGDTFRAVVRSLRVAL